MSDEFDLKKRAQEIAHENSPACQNRPAAFQHGHGKACKKLAKVIELAMLEALEKAK